MARAWNGESGKWQAWTCRAAVAAVVLCCLGGGAPVSAQAPQAGASPGASYRPDDFLTLDLNRAVLSPRPLGPAARFEPYGVEAQSDGLPNTAGSPGRVAGAPKDEQREQQAASRTQEANTEAADERAGPTWQAGRDAAEHKTARSTAERSRAASTTSDSKKGARSASRPAEHRTAERRTVHRLAVRRHANPLDAQAFDARPQVWPCRGTSGICAWR